MRSAGGSSSPRASPWRSFLLAIDGVPIRSSGNQRRATGIFAADYRGTPHPNVPAGVLGSVSLKA
jgi:hypothetical protein